MKVGFIAGPLCQTLLATLVYLLSVQRTLKNLDFSLGHDTNKITKGIFI